MRALKLSVLSVSPACSLVGRSQVVTGSTTATLDPNTGIVTATCETDLDGDAQVFYAAQVNCKLTDGHGAVLAQQGYDDSYNEGYAQVILTYQGVFLVDQNGATRSDVFMYYNAVSCTYTVGQPQPTISADVTGDNTSAAGKIPLTWNLQ